ncbi:MAG TPA: hypothetical protein VMM79_14335 [Longimicrobiales bacterium]|nr:hypothetical protein [Longimicrobiales bacterium]
MTQVVTVFVCVCGSRLAIVGAADGARAHRCAACGTNWAFVLGSGAIVAAYPFGPLSPDAERQVEENAAGELARHYSDDPTRRAAYHTAITTHIRYPRLARLLELLPERLALKIATRFLPRTE